MKKASLPGDAFSLVEREKLRFPAKACCFFAVAFFIFWRRKIALHNLVNPVFRSAYASLHFLIKLRDALWPLGCIMRKKMLAQ